MNNHPYPLEIDRDNRDNRDKSWKPLQRKAFRLSIMPNEPGHSRDTPGHFVIRTFQAARKACITESNNRPRIASGIVALRFILVAHSPGHLSRPARWSGSLGSGAKHLQRCKQSAFGV